MTILNYDWYKLGIFVLYSRTVSSKDNFRWSTDGYKTLAKNIPELHIKGKLGFHFEIICNPNSHLLSVLITNKAVYRHNCFSKYSDSKLLRFTEPSKKRKCTEDEKGRKSTRLSADSRERFDLFCCWCSKKNVNPNLVPAGTYQATKLTTKSNHLKDLTAKWIEIATKLNDEPVLRLLSSGDVASNELCYHDKCYDTTRCQYSKFTQVRVRRKLEYARYRMQTDSIEKNHILFERQWNVKSRKFLSCDGAWNNVFRPT